MNEARKLMSYIALQSIFAWRLLWMTFLNRNTPDISCETVLTENEWKTLWLKKTGEKLKLESSNQNHPKIRQVFTKP